MGGCEPLKIFTDHLAIVLGLRRGRLRCCSGKRAHADVWCMVWFVMEDMDGPIGCVAHCKAHRRIAAWR